MYEIFGDRQQRLESLPLSTLSLAGTGSLSEPEKKIMKFENDAIICPGSELVVHILKGT